MWQLIFLAQQRRRLQSLLDDSACLPSGVSATAMTTSACRSVEAMAAGANMPLWSAARRGGRHAPADQAGGCAVYQTNGLAVYRNC